MGNVMITITPERLCNVLVTVGLGFVMGYGSKIPAANRATPMSSIHQWPTVPPVVFNDGETAVVKVRTLPPQAKKAIVISQPDRPSSYSLIILHEGSNSGSRKWSRARSARKVTDKAIAARASNLDLVGAEGKEKVACIIVSTSCGTASGPGGETVRLPNETKLSHR
jgi:hypothetical protein